jgi:hypothetical protein
MNALVEVLNKKRKGGEPTLAAPEQAGQTAPTRPGTRRMRSTMAAKETYNEEIRDRACFKHRSGR